MGRRTARLRDRWLAEPMILRVVLPSLILAALLTPVTMHGQQAGKVARVGLLFSSTPAPWVESLRAFRQRVRELGWTEGQNLVLNFRYADNKADDLPALAAELVAEAGRHLRGRRIGDPCRGPDRC